MQWKQRIEHATHSDVGMRRDNNEDNCVVQMCAEEEVWRSSGHLFLVADGMGGHAVGELASKLAAETVPHTFFKCPPGDQIAAIRTALTTANSVIYDRGAGSPEFERMGTTCSTLILSSPGAIIGHVGDSRVYRIRAGRIDQLTFDHSLHWELIRTGQLKEGAAFANKNVITRCLGPEAAVDVDVEGPFPIETGDRYVLCSDGLTAHLDDSEIGQVTASLPAEKASKALVNLANLRGGSDNCTVVVVDVSKDEGEGKDTKQRKPIPIWVWLLAAATILAVVAVVAFVFKQVPAGIGAVVGAIAGGIAGFVMRSRSEKNDSSVELPVSNTKPYRSATARVKPETVESILGQIEACINDSSAAEIPFDRAELEVQQQKATAALKKQKRASSMRAALKALDLCMTAIEEHRRSLDLAARWGKSAD